MFQQGGLEKVREVVTHKVKGVGFDADGGEVQLGGSVQLLGL